MECPSCGANAGRRARFCDQCGARLMAPGAELAHDHEPVEEGDRRVVTALFADLVDYVRMIAEHDPEEVRIRVRTALGRMAEAIERVDGTREKFIGDAVFAVFGWPRAHDDDPVLAALAALAVRAALRETDDGSEPLEVRIGLATGEVVAAARGDGTGDLAVTGEAITTAARIQSLAGRGEILLDDATVRGARDRLVVDDRGSVVLRGQSAVIHLFALTGEHGLAWPRARRASPETALIGRAGELERARSILRRAWDAGTGAVVLVTGDAGMGKSRLVAELEGDARGLGYAWTWTESVSYGRGEPYRFARRFAQAIADEHGVDSGSYTRALLFKPEMDEAAIRRYRGAIAAVARDAAFSGWEEEAALVPDDPTEIAAALGEVATAYINGTLAADGPRVIVLDDVHWLDASSVGMVELLVATAAVRPLVILATTRPGSTLSWSTAAHVERIDLTGLAQPETASLRRSSRAPRSTRMTRGADDARRNEAARDVLGVASVIGIDFHQDELEGLMERSIAPGTLDRLVDAALIVLAEDETWRFSHPLVHETAYAGMLGSRRRRLHARLADRFEAGQPLVSVASMAVHRVLPQGTASARSRCSWTPPPVPSRLGAPAEAAAFWRSVADLSTDSADILQFRAAATAALAVVRE